MCMAAECVGCDLRLCLLHKQNVFFGVGDRWTLSCSVSLWQSGSSDSPLSPRPNEEGVVLCARWKKGGGIGREEWLSPHVKLVHVASFFMLCLLS